jgi:hypothetical protein
MIKSESNLVFELWEQVREYIPAARRTEVAVGFIKSFSDFGFEKEDFHDIIDEDEALSAAYSEFFNDDYDEHENEEDDYNTEW